MHIFYKKTQELIQSTNIKYRFLAYINGIHLILFFLGFAPAVILRFQLFPVYHILDISTDSNDFWRIALIYILSIIAAHLATLYWRSVFDRFLLAHDGYLLPKEETLEKESYWPEFFLTISWSFVDSLARFFLYRFWILAFASSLTSIHLHPYFILLYFFVTDLLSFGMTLFLKQTAKDTLHIVLTRVLSLFFGWYMIYIVKGDILLATMVFITAMKLGMLGQSVSRFYSLSKSE